MEEIRSRLAYREENKKKLAKFFPHLTFEGSKNVYINPWNEEFIVTDLSDRHEGNPDLIRFSQVSSVHTESGRTKKSFSARILIAKERAMSYRDMSATMHST